MEGLLEELIVHLYVEMERLIAVLLKRLHLFYISSINFEGTRNFRTKASFSIRKLPIITNLFLYILFQVPS